MNLVENQDRDKPVYDKYEVFTKSTAKDIFREKIESLSVVFRKETSKLDRLKKRSSVCPDNEDWFYDYLIAKQEAMVRQVNKLSFKFQARINVLEGKTYDGYVDIEPILEIPISTIMDRKVEVKGMGKEFYKSPFREEKQASFVVYTDNNTWCDFGTNEGGNVIALYMKLYDCDFKTAINNLK